MQHFAESCVRLQSFADDLHKFAAPENVWKTITLSEVPKSYRAADVVKVIENACGVKLQDENVLFRYKRGVQAAEAYVLTNTVQEAARILAVIKEIAIPAHAMHAGLMGSVFLWARRSTIFLRSSCFERDTESNEINASSNEEPSGDAIAQATDAERDLASLKEDLEDDWDTAFLEKVTASANGCNVVVERMADKQMGKLEQNAPSPTIYAEDTAARLPDPPLPPHVYTAGQLRSRIAVFGWAPDLSIQDFKGLMRQFNIMPDSVSKWPGLADPLPENAPRWGPCLLRTVNSCRRGRTRFSCWTFSASRTRSLPFVSCTGSSAAGASATKPSCTPTFVW